MFLYKFNWHNKKYYKYDTDDVDLFSPMFDDNLHDNNVTHLNLSKRVCMYCNTCFPSRNKLFYHLSYMNINTKPYDDNESSTNMDEDRKDGYQSDKGEYGYEIKRIKSLNKIRRLHKKRRYWLIKKNVKRQKRNNKKRVMSDIINLLSEKLTIDT